jgi:hypothetical protein
MRPSAFYEIEAEAFDPNQRVTSSQRDIVVNYNRTQRAKFTAEMRRIGVTASRFFNGNN